MTPDLQSAQLHHDFRLPPECFAVDETTDAEALEALCLKAAASTRDIFADGCEVEVSPHVDGTSAVKFTLLGVRFEDHKQMADWFIRMGSYFLSTERK